MRTKFNSLFIFDLLIHIAFLFTILFLFFILVGFQEEKKGLVSNIDNKSKIILDQSPEFQNMKKEYQQLPPKEQEIYFNLLLEKIESNTTFKKTHNSLLKGFGYFMIVLLWTASIYLGYYLMQKGKMGRKFLKDCILNNIILFSVICSIEVLFFFYVILKFQPITNQEINDIFIRTYNKKNENNQNIENTENNN